MQKTIIAAVLAAVLAGALGFFGGVTYQKSQTPSFGGRSGAGGFNRQGGAAGFRANVATGTVIAQDATSITIKSADGGSKTVFISAQTEISKQQVLKPADIKVGDQVGAFGQAATGGITAAVIQIIPPGGTFRFGGGGRGFGGGGQSTGQGGAQGGTQGGSQGGDLGGPPPMP
jgi:hypothetical protein